MLEQLRAAEAFAEAFLTLTRASSLGLAFTSGEQPIAATITLDLEGFLTTWSAFMRWHTVRPDGDDWAAPVDPPSTTRVPPE